MASSHSICSGYRFSASLGHLCIWPSWLLLSQIANPRPAITWTSCSLDWRAYKNNQILYWNYLTKHMEICDLWWQLTVNKSWSNSGWGSLGGSCNLVNSARFGLGWGGSDLYLNQRILDGQRTKEKSVTSLGMSYEKSRRWAWRCKVFWCVLAFKTYEV